MGGDQRNSESKRRSDSTDSPAEKRVHKEKIPLEDLVEDRKLLASIAVNSLSWDLVVGMLPEYLKNRSKKEVISLISDELEGMSKRRINAILEGDDIPTSSSSESESSHSNREDDDSARYSEDIEREEDTSYNSRSRSQSSSSRSLSRSETDDDDEIVIYD